jgi:hypothetical protein
MLIVMTTLITQHLRDLSISPHRHPRGMPHLSAASGLVILNKRCYVVADDEHHLAMFGSETDSPVTLVRLFAGDLPDEKVLRKALKADLEVLVFIAPDSRWSGFPNGALLALGSGSRRVTREKGMLLTLASDGSIAAMKPLDLSKWYAPLRQEFADLNIEGGLVSVNTFRLLQRANTGDPRNACIEYDWPVLMQWFVGERAEPPPVARIALLDLGAVDGVPLGVTDAAAVTDDLWAVSAAAENTDNSYADGPCLASAIALIDNAHRVLAQFELADAPKVEGLVASSAAGRVRFVMVTDSDNPAIASQIRTASVALPAGYPHN